MTSRTAHKCDVPGCNEFCQGSIGPDHDTWLTVYFPLGTSLRSPHKEPMHACPRHAERIERGIRLIFEKVGTIDSSGLYGDVGQKLLPKRTK